MKKIFNHGSVYIYLVFLLLLFFAMFSSCTPHPTAISKGYRNPSNYHREPAKNYSGPNSGAYYKK